MRLHTLLCLLLLSACANNESPDPGTNTAPDSVAPEELGIIHPGSPEPGGLAPDFALRDLEENLVRLSDLRGKPLVLNFFASWCVPCLAEMPLLEEADVAATAIVYAHVRVWGPDHPLPPARGCGSLSHPGRASSSSDLVAALVSRGG